MARLNKLFNANYLHDVPAAKRVVNEKNRVYIDRFVMENYNRLSNQFKGFDGIVNSSCYSAMDKLNETIFALYTDVNICFGSWDDANAYLRNKFTEKEMRVPTKKQSKAESFRIKKILTKTIWQMNKVLKYKKCGKEIQSGFYNTPDGAYCCGCWERTPQAVKMQLSLKP